MNNDMKSCCLVVLLGSIFVLSGCQRYDPAEIPVAKISQAPLKAIRDENGKLVVIAPECAPVTKHNQEEYYSQELGCANQYNLARMIANPKDLEPQEPDREPIAGPLIRAYNKYKNGDQKTTPKQTLQNGISNAFGASSQ